MHCTNCLFAKLSIHYLCVLFNVLADDSCLHHCTCTCPKAESNRGGKCNFASPFAIVHAPIGLQQKRQSASKASAAEERGAREETGRGGRPGAEGGAVEAGGGGGGPGRGGRAWQRLMRRRCRTPTSIPSLTLVIRAPPVVIAGSSCVGVGGELLKWRGAHATSIWGRVNPGEEEVAWEGWIPTRRRCRVWAEEVAREGRGRVEKCDAVDAMAVGGQCDVNEVQNTVHTRQTSICLPKLYIIVGLSLSWV
jgi:hypothetical protein